MFKSTCLKPLKSLRDDFVNAASRADRPTHVLSDNRWWERIPPFDYAPAVEHLGKAVEAATRNDYEDAYVLTGKAYDVLWDRVCYLRGRLPGAGLETGRMVMLHEIANMEDNMRRIHGVRSDIRRDETAYVFERAAAEPDALRRAAQSLDGSLGNVPGMANLFVAAGRLLVRQEQELKDLRADVEALKARLAEYESPGIVLDKKQVHALKPPGGNANGG